MWWHREYSYSATRSGWEDGSPGIVPGHPQVGLVYQDIDSVIERPTGTIPGMTE